MEHCPACEEVRRTSDRVYCDNCRKSIHNAFCPVNEHGYRSPWLWLMLVAVFAAAVVLNWMHPASELMFLYAIPIVLFSVLVMNTFMVTIFAGATLAVYFMLTPMHWTSVIPPLTIPVIVLLVKRLIVVSRNNYKQKLENEELFMNTVLSFSKSIDARDPYTAFHSRNVAEYGRKIAKELGLGQDQAEAVYLAGLIHDIGKIGTPESVLNKEGGLTDEEYETMKKHPEDGFLIIENITRLREMGVTDMVRYHHERPDGRGYPEGLTLEEIPLGARILGASDAFDAMTTNRSYRKKLSVDTAVGELERHSGTQFDPKVVKAFLSVLRKEGKIGQPAKAFSVTAATESTA